MRVRSRLRVVPAPTAPEPNPRPRIATLSFDSVSDHRRLYCRRYDDCLNVAEAGRWFSFTCAQCPVRDELTHAERRAQADAIGRALRDHGHANLGGVGRLAGHP